MKQLARILCALMLTYALAFGQLPSGTPTVSVNAKWVTDKGSQVFNVKAYGATGNGTTDDTAATLSAISAALANGGGVAYFPAGNYILSGSGLSIVYASGTTTRIALTGAGAGSTTLTYSGSGDALYIASNPFNLTRGGLVSDLTITCTGTATSGIHISDVIGYTLRNVRTDSCNGTSTSAGFWFDNQNLTSQGWTEGTRGDNLATNDDSIGYRFTDTSGTNSFGYSNLDLYCNMIAAKETCLQTENDVFLYHSTLMLRANANATSHTIISLLGTSDIGSVNGNTGDHVVIFSEVTNAASYTGFKLAAGTVFVGEGDVDMAGATNADSNSPGGILIHPHFVDDTIASLSNFQGTGNTASFSAALSASESARLSYFGFISGPNLNSSFATFYDAQPGNGFFIYGVPYQEGSAPSTWTRDAFFQHGVAGVSGTFSIYGGTNVVYRCLTAGTALPIGSLTINPSACGSTTDTGLRVK